MQQWNFEGGMQGKPGETRGNDGSIGDGGRKGSMVGNVDVDDGVRQSGQWWCGPMMLG